MKLIKFHLPSLKGASANLLVVRRSRSFEYMILIVSQNLFEI